MDTIVFDIETQNFFTDPGVGRDNFAALKISVVGAYSYVQDRYFTFEEYQIGECIDLFRDAERIVGFSSNRYDIPVLNGYFRRHRISCDLWKKERIDLLEEIELATDERISLSRLAEANLGEAKEQHGLEAIQLYREGKMDELKKYCLNDVRLTKEIYDLYVKQHYLMVPSKRTGEIVKVEFAKPMA